MLVLYWGQGFRIHQPTDNPKGLVLAQWAFVTWIALSFFWSDNTADYLFRVVSFLPLLLCSVGFRYVSKEQKQKLIWAVYGFVLVSLAVVLVNVTFAAFDAPTHEDVWAYVVYENLARPTRLQAIYLSMTMVMTILFFLGSWDSIPVKKTVKYAVLLVLYAFIIMLSSRMEIMVMLFLACMATLVRVVIQKKVMKSGLVVVFLVGVTSALILGNRVNRERFTEMVDLEQDYTENKYGGRSLRIQKWLNAVETWQNNIWIGTGAGDSQDELNATYKNNGFSLALQHNFNVHNQYLQTLMGYGVIGLLLLGIMLFAFLWYAWQNKNVFLLFFLGIILLSFLTESMLERQTGIVLFAFYGNLLVALLPKFDNIGLLNWIGVKPQSGEQKSKIS